MRFVYVCGVGAVSSLGRSWPETFAALEAGHSAIRPITRFDVEGFPSRVGASVDVEDDGGGRQLALALPAAREAWSAAGIEARRSRIGIFVGAESGRLALRSVLELARAAGGGTEFDHERFGREGRTLALRLGSPVVSPAAVASSLAAEMGAGGPVETVSLACASGSAAIAEAARAIRLGECDVALAGGVGADVDPLMFAGFGLLGALSERGVSRPFDARRDGFVVGEGAAMLVLSNERHRAVSAISGLGRSLDGWRLTAPDPGGSGAERAMRAALADAEADHVDYVQAHGTSTPLNDAVEAAAIRRVLGGGLDGALVSSVKGALGHWIAGAGALGVLCAHAAIASGVVLPTAGLEVPDPDCALPHVIGRSVRARVETALVNSFAFGGANCSLVLKRCP